MPRRFNYRPSPALVVSNRPQSAADEAPGRSGLVQAK